MLNNPLDGPPNTLLKNHVERALVERRKSVTQGPDR